MSSKADRLRFFLRVTTQVFSSSRTVAPVAGAQHALEERACGHLAVPQGQVECKQAVHMQDQLAQAALAANLLCPDYVQVVCGTLDQLPQAFATLDQTALNSTTPLQRKNNHAALRKRIPAWAADGGLCVPNDQQPCSPTDARAP